MKKLLVLFLISITGISLKAQFNDLKLTFPLEGDTLIYGTDTLISWEGVSPADTIAIDYSSDDGKKWQNLTNEATGLQYLWKVPRMANDSMLFKITKRIDVESIMAGQSWKISFDVPQYSPDGTKLAFTGEGDLFILDPATMEKTVIDVDLDLNGGFEWNPQGDKIASITDQGFLCVIDVASKNIIQQFKYNDSKCISWNPGGNLIAAGSEWGGLSVWDINLGNKLYSIKAHSLEVTSLQWNSDGTEIYTGGYKGKIRFWNAADGTQIVKKDAKGEYFDYLENSFTIRNLSLSPDDSKIAAADTGGTVLVWDLKAGTKAELKDPLIRENDDFILWVAWSPDGSKLAASSFHGLLNIWDVDNKMVVKSKFVNPLDLRMSWHPGGSMLVTSSWSRTIENWDINNPENNFTLLSKDGNNKLSADKSRIAYFDSDFLKIMDTDSFIQEKGFNLRLGQSFLGINADFSRMVTHDSSYIEYWDLSVDSIVSKFYYNPGKLVSVNNSMDKFLFSRNDSIYIYSVPDWQPVTKFHDGGLGGYFRSYWSGDDSKIAIMGINDTARVWDAATGKVISSFACPFRDNHTHIVDLFWNSKSDMIAAKVSSTTAKVWEAGSGKELYTFECDWNINKMHWNPAGDMIATLVYHDNYIRVWDPVTGEVLKKLFINENMKITDICWKPGTNILLSFDEQDDSDSYLKLWDVETGEMLSSYWLSVDPSLAQFHGDGETLTCGAYYLSVLDFSEIVKNQQDINESNWSIYIPEIDVKQIELGEIAVNSVKDTLVTSILKNVGKYPIRIDEAYFSGYYFSFFSIISEPEYPVYLKPSDSLNISFSYFPAKKGYHSAYLTFKSSIGDIMAHIIGDAFDPNSVGTALQISGLNVYPNPASNMINVDFNRPYAGPVSVLLYDLSGRLLYYKETTSEGIKIDAAGLSNGIYRLIIKTPEGTFSEKVSVLK